MKNILNGKVFTRQLDEWYITWESYGFYRYWCYQHHRLNHKDILVIMLNPGSLNGEGKNLTKDTTLRILRQIFEKSGFNPYIINLYDYSASSTTKFFENWDARLGKVSIYDKIKLKEFSGVIYAYGDFENYQEYGLEIKKRINFIKKVLEDLPEIILPTNKSGTPKHPIVWQRQKIKPEVKTIIKKYSESLK